MTTHRQRNEETYKQLKGELERTYRGQFVAIARGKLVAAGATLEEVTAQAEAAAPGASHRLVFKVGETYPALLRLVFHRSVTGADKKRWCWLYQQGVPVMTIHFVSQGMTLTKTLQMDTGFSGELLIDWETFTLLKLQRSELPRELWPEAQGFGGRRRLRGGYLTIELPELEFRQPHIAYSAPRLGDEWNLVGLKFLDQFLWSGDGREFCLEKK